MSGGVQVRHVQVMPPYWTVPANLADFECRHGELDGCTACAREDQQAELERELELEATA